MTLDDDILVRALRKSRDSELEKLPDTPEEPHQFTEKFERQMTRLVKSEKLSPFHRGIRTFTRRAAVFVLVGFVGLSVSVLSVDAWREQLFEMVEEKFPEYSSISYAPVAGSGAESLPAFDLVEYRPAYLPEGYLLVDQILGANINWSQYGSPEGGSFSFHQSILGSVGSSINTEGSKLDEFQMQNGEIAYKMSNRGAEFVLWSDNQYEYIVVAQGIPLEEAVKVAESTAICPPDAPHPPQLEVQCSDLPENYPIEVAAKDGVVAVADGGKRIENLAALDRWFKDYEAGKQTIVMLADYDNGTPVTHELYFNGIEVSLTTDETRLLENPGEGTLGEHFKKISRINEGDDVVVVLVRGDGGKTELMRYAAQN